MTDVKGLSALELMAIAKAKMKEEKQVAKANKPAGKRVTSYYVPEARVRFERACEITGVSESGFQFAATMKEVDLVLKDEALFAKLAKQPEKTLAEQLSEQMKEAV